MAEEFTPAGSASAEELDGTTAVVHRMGSTVRKIHPASVGWHEAHRLKLLSHFLHAEGFPAPELLSWTYGPPATTHWRYVGSGPADWTQTGLLLRRLHSLRPPQQLWESLPRLESMETHRGLYSSLGSLSREESQLLACLEAAVERALALLPRLPEVLTHDDLWEKNLVSDDRGRTWLIDWDFTCRASRLHDLSFVVRGMEREVVTPHQAALFSEAYGYELPPLEVAKASGTLHRARWVVTLLQRSRSGEARAAAQLTEEAPLWSAHGSPA